MEGRALLSGVPYMYSNSSSVVEHGTAPVVMNFAVDLTSASTTPVTVNYQTSDGARTAGVDYAATATTSNLTALAGVNYVAESKVLTFAPGHTTAQFSVTILGSTRAATDYFLVTLSRAGVAIGQSQGSGVIVY
jgi:hypothetical protein